MILLRLRTWYKVHKWTAIFAGVALIMWLLTGMAMSSPKIFPETPSATGEQPDYQAIELSPAEAIARLETETGQTYAVTGVSIRRILDTVAYEIRTTEGETYLINAQSNDQFEITSDLAEQIALAEFPTGANIIATERIDFNSRQYPFGPVPVYRVSFDDEPGTYSHVSIKPSPVWGANTGDVRRTTRWGRLRELLGSLHTFGVLRVIINKGRLITLLLWAATGLTTLTAIVGYYLALPRRRKTSLNNKP